MQDVRVLTIASAVLTLAVGLSAQQAPAAGQQPQEIRVTIPARPDGPVVQIPRTPAVDQAAHDRGRGIWARECVDCHGTQARGGTGPNIIRTKTVNFDRSSPTPGSVLGPFLKAGHTTQSGKPSAIVHRRRDRRARALPAAARERHDARLGRLHGGRHPGGQSRRWRGVLQRRRQVRVLPHRHRAQPGRHRHQDSRARGHPAADAVPGEQRRPRTWRRGGAERCQRDHGRR